MQPVGPTNFVLVIKQEVGHVFCHMTLRRENLRGLCAFPMKTRGQT